MPWGVAAAVGAGVAGSALSGGFQQQQQRSEQFGGPLEGAQRGEASLALMRRLFGQDIPGQYLPSPYALPNRRLPYTPITPTPLNAMGLYPGQQAGFQEAVQQVLGKLSGNFADRGFNTPRAVQAIAGSAAQNVLPQFAPLMGQQIAGRDELLRQLSLTPAALAGQENVQDIQAQQVAAQRKQQYLDFIQQMIAALGGRSAGAGSGFGIQAQYRGPNTWGGTDGGKGGGTGPASPTGLSVGPTG